MQDFIKKQMFGLVMILSISSLLYAKGVKLEAPLPEDKPSLELEVKNIKTVMPSLSGKVQHYYYKKMTACYAKLVEMNPSDENLKKQMAEDQMAFAPKKSKNQKVAKNAQGKEAAKTATHKKKAETKKAAAPKKTEPFAETKPVIKEEPKVAPKEETKPEVTSLPSKEEPKDEVKVEVKVDEKPSQTLSTETHVTSSATTETLSKSEADKKEAEKISTTEEENLKDEANKLAGQIAGEKDKVETK